MERGARWLEVMRLGVGWGVVAGMIGAAPAAAQLPAVGVPEGMLRVEADGLFEAFDERFRDGEREPYAADLSSEALGSDRIPALAAVDARISSIAGAGGAPLDLGRLSADAHADVSTIRLGLSLGLSDRLTVFGRLPLSRIRTQSRTALDPTGANAGLAPAPEDQTAFFDQFAAALGTLEDKLDAGDYDGNATTKALAEATLADGTLLRDDLFAVLGAPDPSAPFAPLAASATGTAATGAVTILQSTLSSDLDVTGFTATPALPTEPLSSETLRSFLETGLALGPGETELRFRGDAELGMILTLADRWHRGRTPGGFRLAVSGLVRLPTGVRDRSDRLLDLGTGDGQLDVEVGVVTDIGRGRLGARLSGSYLRQFPADINRRVAAPDQPFVGPERLTSIRWDPGDAVTVSVQPFYRLAGALAVQASVEHRRQSADDARYATDADMIPGIAAGASTIGSQSAATSFGIGLLYTNLGQLRSGGTGLPVEASWRFERVQWSEEGLVPAVQRVRASLRLYFGLFD